MKQAFFNHAPRVSMTIALVASLVACTQAVENVAPPAPEPGVITATRNGPEGAAPGTCWGKTVSPAVVERVSERVQISPAVVNPDGTVSKPPVTRAVDRQVIVTPRQNNWFETPCPDVLTFEFVSSLQRAMVARGDYAGPITGQIDVSTRKAIQGIQRQDGLDSGVLSLKTARALGLIAVERTPVE